jgi:hypothetical protein
MASKILILGCERSGSTWIGNVLDAHPDVLFWMEPFAEALTIFPGFPDRNVYLNSVSCEMTELIRGQYETLYGRKYPFFYQPGKSLWWRYADQMLVESYVNLGRWLRFGLSPKIRQYRELNLNTREIPIARQFQKSRHPLVEVTKDLRLNFKVRVLASVFPDAKYIAAVRHPGAQIGSIKRMFGKKRLDELQRALRTFAETIAEQKRFEIYQEMIEKAQDDPDEKLILWWVVNYQTLLGDLAGCGLPYQVVSNEVISENPAQVMTDLLAFCGLGEHAQVGRYLHESSSSEEKVDFAPVDTNRDSAKYYKRRIAETPEELNTKIQRVLSRLVEQGLLNDALRRYVENVGS